MKNGEESHLSHEVFEVTQSLPTKQELLEMLQALNKNLAELPPQALYAPVNHADFGSLISLLCSIFLAD